jgi:hypothetical protein
MTDLPPRPAAACLLCPPPHPGRPWRLADGGYVTCSDCYDRCRTLLADTARRWLLLNPRPGQCGEPGRGTPGFGSRSPAADHIIVMRDKRSSATAHVWLAHDGRIHAEAERPPLSVWSVLDTLCWEVAEARRVDGPDPVADVPDQTRWLDRHLDWITRQAEAATDLHTALRALGTQLRPVTGDPGRRLIGHCPVTIDDGDHTRECGARLYAPLRGDRIACNACGEVWPRDKWLRLGLVLQAS